MSLNKTLPLELTDLIDRGFWPTTEEMALAQNEQCKVNRQLLEEFINDEAESLYFYRPPFSSGDQWRSEGHDMQLKMVTTGVEMSAKQILILGDFGPGSDAFWGLYFENNCYDSPIVVREKWTDNGEKLGWATMARDFKELCEKLEIL